jgi:predicted ATP-grasp superfamily ATP-dependent carboligase
MKSRVLVTDGEQRAALAVVRSLGRAGFEVYVCSARRKSLAGVSRFCTGTRQVADPLHQAARFLEDVVRFAAEKKIDVVLPVTEAALLAILPQRDRFKCAIPFPSAADFLAICDKSIVLREADKLGISVPRQTKLETPSAAETLERDLKFPMVIKPSRSVAGTEGDRVRAGVSYVRDRTSLLLALSRMPVNAYPVLLQQQIVGPGFGVSVLVWDGSLVAAFAHRRIREKPPSGGVSVLRESIPLDADLLKRSLTLLDQFHWRGVAMVEYKIDSASGAPYLMEINGRLWGSLQLAIDAGVDFPRLLADLALGVTPSSVDSYDTNVRSRWEWGDVDNLLASMRHAAKFAAIAPGLARGRLRTAVDFLRGFGARNRPEVFNRDDPKPFLRESLDWFRRR